MYWMRQIDVIQSYTNTIHKHWNDMLMIYLCARGLLSKAYGDPMFTLVFWQNTLDFSVILICIKVKIVFIFFPGKSF